MAPPALPETFWSEQIDFAADMLRRRDEAGGISKLKSLLLDSRLPCYWRIRAYAFLAKASEDWYEAEDYQYAAEMLWTSTRNLIPFKQDNDFDEVTNENRSFLNRLAVQMDTDMPEDLRTFRKISDGDEEQAEESQVSSTLKDKKEQDNFHDHGVGNGVGYEEEEVDHSVENEDQADGDQEESEDAQAEEAKASAIM
ncbi:hypothetical protein E4T39_04451 [Aureobasidium subglaciale]|nr:hypothetical protein E4T39_04451 [Aureobasidium subglaciale]